MEKRLIEKIVNAMCLEKGEIVLLNLWGRDEEVNDLYDFAAAVAGAGAMPVTMLHSPEYYGKLFGAAKAVFDERWYSRFDAADVVIDIINMPPGLPPEGLLEDCIPLFVDYLQGLFARFSQKKKYIQITMPTPVNAKYAGMDFEVFRERTMKALDIDYDCLKKDCEDKLNSFEGKIRKVYTGRDCVLTLDTTERNWLVDAGEGSFPCGEIYIAPVEENTNGTIYFETLAVEGVGVYKDVTVKIENGRIAESDCKEFDEFIAELPEGANVVAELGIGMNPNVAKVLGDSGLDENAVGTLHIAIGMNHLFGGKNRSPIHIDFVTEGMVE